MKTMKVVIPGVLTTVQDLGRFGYQKSGMTCSGVMDTAAYRKANDLVGNEEGAAVLEMTLYGGSCRFEEDTVIALTGACIQPTVNQKPIAMNQAVKVPAGGVLNLGMAKTGCRTYLAVAGGFEVPKVMGSYSTNLKCGIGGHEGRALQMGDELPIGEALHSWDEVKDRLNKSALGMSGGQQQRLCIARALAVQPEVLLMDEPTSALDPISTSKIEDLVIELKKEYTVIIVTHNMQQATRVSDKTAFFLLGEVVEFNETEQLFSNPNAQRTEAYITGRFG